MSLYIYLHYKSLKHVDLIQLVLIIYVIQPVITIDFI